jgi:hypothetical protein
MTTRKPATPVTARPIQPREIAYYGWRKDTPDQRDLMLAPRGVTRLPSSVDLQATGFVPPTNDQLQLGSCAGNASAEAFEFALRKLGLTDYRPSRLFTYLEARRIEGTVASDAGCEIRADAADPGLPRRGEASAHQVFPRRHERDGGQARARGGLSGRHRVLGVREFRV